MCSGAVFTPTACQRTDDNLIPFDHWAVRASAVAGEAANQDTYSAVNDVVLIAFIIMLIFVNSISVTALSVGKQTRHKLLHGLLAMYSDNDVDKYYDASLLTNYDRRYTLFTGVILCLAATAVIVPLIIRFV